MPRANNRGFMRFGACHGWTVYSTDAPAGQVRKEAAQALPRMGSVQEWRTIAIMRPPQLLDREVLELVPPARHHLARICPSTGVKGLKAGRPLEEYSSVFAPQALIGDHLCGVLVLVRLLFLAL